MRISDHIRGNLVGYVALFVALSSTAWAANGPLAGRNTVGSADLINGDVRRSDVARNAINSTKVANGTLQTVDFAPGTLLEGRDGATGPQGPGGPEGPPDHPAVACQAGPRAAI
jgi:hypothetical protein